jgi:exosortase F-associated protein
MVQKLSEPRLTNSHRVILIVISLLLLATAYLFQRTDFLSLLAKFVGGKLIFHPYVNFIFNKTLRLIWNDAACCLLIFAFFKEKKYLKVGVFLFLFELLIVLPVYFFIKLSLEGDSEISSPLLSQIHRLIVNPMLMIVLLIGLMYQRFVLRQEVR